MKALEKARALSGSPLGYVILLFLATRIVLTLVGMGSHGFLEHIDGREFTWHYSHHGWLSVWALWDAGWYLDIAKNGYALSLVSDLPRNVDPGQINFGFFPLYPLCIWLVSKIIHGHFLVSALLVSNVCLVLAGLLLYKLVRIDWPEREARRAVLYLFVFPVSFILSAVFAESLFLVLSVALFYALRKERYVLGFLAGIGLGLCRPAALFVVPAVALALAMAPQLNRKKIALSLVACAGIPLGYFLFSLFCYTVTGDWSLYTHLKLAAWGAAWTNPLLVLARCFLSKDVTVVINGFAVAAGSALVVLAWKKIGTVHALLGLLLLILPLTAGGMIIRGMLRYTAAVFPLFIACSVFARNRFAHGFTIAVFCILQLIFMAVWTNGFPLIV
jgi:hypothetical protein